MRLKLKEILVEYSRVTENIKLGEKDLDFLYETSKKTLPKFLAEYWEFGNSILKWKGGEGAFLVIPEENFREFLKRPGWNIDEGLLFSGSWCEGYETILGYLKNNKESQLSVVNRICYATSWVEFNKLWIVGDKLGKQEVCQIKFGDLWVRLLTPHIHYGKLEPRTKVKICHTLVGPTRLVIVGNLKYFIPFTVVPGYFIIPGIHGRVVGKKDHCNIIGNPEYSKFIELLLRNAKPPKKETTESAVRSGRGTPDCGPL